MSRHLLNRVTDKTRQALPPETPDASGAGVNYADALITLLKVTLEDGRKVVARRRGLEITLQIGDHKGSALLRRLEHGPDIETIVHRALSDAAADAGSTLVVEQDEVWLEATT